MPEALQGSADKGTSLLSRRVQGVQFSLLFPALNLYLLFVLPLMIATLLQCAALRMSTWSVYGRSARRNNYCHWTSFGNEQWSLGAGASQEEGIGPVPLHNTPIHTGGCSKHRRGSAILLVSALIYTMAGCSAMTGLYNTPAADTYY